MHCRDFFSFLFPTRETVVGETNHGRTRELGPHPEFFAYSHKTLPVSLGRQQTIVTFPVFVTRTTFYSEMSVMTEEYHRPTYFLSNKWFARGNLNLICECIVHGCFRSYGTDTSAILAEHIFGVSLLSALMMYTRSLREGNVFTPVYHSVHRGK